MARIAARSAVTSVKLITKPPSGISSAETVSIVSAPARMSKVRGGRGPVPEPQSASLAKLIFWPRWTRPFSSDRSEAKAAPRRAPATGIDRSSARRRFQPSIRPSASKMQTPWLI